MHDYYCRSCRLLFENSLRQVICACGSQRIKEINMSCKGVTLSNVEWTMEEEGQKNEKFHDRQGRLIRQSVYDFIQEQLKNTDNNNITS